MKIVNNDREIIKIITARKEIEEELIRFNRSHYQKAYETKVYQDKIYQKLGDNIIRNKILNRKLERDECEDQAVCDFLKLLEQLENLKNITQQFALITEEE